MDKNTGGKCLMIAARKLGIIWGGTPAYWEWLSHPDARFYTFSGFFPCTLNFEKVTLLNIFTEGM